MPSPFSASERSSKSPCVLNPSTREKVHWFGKHSGCFEVHPMPLLQKVQQRMVETGQPSQQNAFTIGSQHRKLASAKARAHLSQQLKRHGWHAVAARAGIRHALTHQSPLTHRHVRDARKHLPSLGFPQCIAMRAAKTIASTPKHAPLGTYATEGDPKGTSGNSCCRKGQPDRRDRQ